jgi:hypothetical protein
MDADFWEKIWALFMSAPGTFIVFAIVSFGLGLGLGRFTYTQELQSARDSAARYRVALGIEPGSSGALVELTNRELKSMAFIVVARLRAIDNKRDKQISDIQQNKSLDNARKKEQSDNILRELNDEYLSTVRNDAFNIDFELRKRLGPQAVAGIIGVNPRVMSDDGASINILQLTPESHPIFNMGFIGVLANGIDQMAKLLPD